MDIKDKRDGLGEMDGNSKYPRWVGVVLSLFVPGSAQFLSGRKGGGFLWFVVLSLVPFAGYGVAIVPREASVHAMYAINFILLPLLFITMLCASYRPVRRLRLRGRIGFVAVFLSLTVGTALLRGFLPSSPFRVPAGAMEPTLRGTTTSREKTQGSSMEWFWHGKNRWSSGPRPRAA